MSLRHLIHTSLFVAATLSAGCFSPKYASPGFACDSSDPKLSECPDGQTCGPAKSCIDSIGGGNNGSCVSTFAITKSGSYTGTHIDPMLDTEAQCTDASLEPNDTSCQAVVLPTIAVGGTPLKLQSLAICPTGNNPKASGHDVDVYQITVPSQVNVLVEMTYDIQYGDLDLGIFRADGGVSASDGSSVSNACVSAALGAGTYYIAVVGAANTAVNRYELSIRYATTALTCTAAN